MPKRKKKLSPLELMLENMHHFYRLAMESERQLEALAAGEDGRSTDKDGYSEMVVALAAKTIELRRLSQACALNAAPYVHGRLRPHDDRPDDIVPLAERLKAYQREGLLGKAADKKCDCDRKSPSEVRREVLEILGATMDEVRE